MRGRRRKDKDGNIRLPVLADFSSIEVFVAIMETRSISKAASRLNTAPSVVSHRLTTLESLAQVKLFNRTTRSVSLTEA
ncbi:LysR family transcriptional regulator, partial [Azospirillum rugosum]|uniref:LysR family transcriptional regulator n=1 Tax=Azospirillum rugosum TaxID=416170 RepID=UPI003615892F